MVDRQFRCPVCGAPVEGEKCEYCGCVIYDFANISMDEPRYIRMKINNPYDRYGGSRILQMKAIVVNSSLKIEPDDVMYEFDNKCMVRRSQACSMTVEFRAVEDNGKLYEIILEDR